MPKAPLLDDDDSFQPNDHPIEPSEVDELRQQLRRLDHASLPPPPPMKRTQQGGRHHRTFRILVISLALTVVLASVIAFVSYLAIQRRSNSNNNPPRGNNQGNDRPPVVNVSPAPSVPSSTLSPTISSAFSPVAPAPTKPRPTRSPISSPVTKPTPTKPRPTRSPISSPVTKPTPTKPRATRSPISSPVVVTKPTPPIPRPTRSPISSPVVVATLAPAPKPVVVLPPPTRKPVIQKTASPTMNPTDTRAPTVDAVPIIDMERPTLSPQVILPPIFLPTPMAAPTPRNTQIPVVPPVAPPVAIQPRTRAPAGFTPTMIAPIPYQRAPTAPPECLDTGDCAILANFPYLLDFLCFDEELGIADECAQSCGVCGTTTSTTLKSCVDDKSAFFLVNDYWGYQSCKWLSTKAELRPDLCQPGADGHKHCPRLCGRCNPLCQDDARAAIFIDYDIGYKTCSWLAKHPKYQTTLCQPDAFGSKSCHETCGQCAAAVVAYRQSVP